MTVNTIGQSTYASGLQQKQQNMNNMFTALKCGDMAAAQKAAVALVQANLKAQQSSVLAMLGQGTRVNTWG